MTYKQFYHLYSDVMVRTMAIVIFAGAVGGGFGGAHLGYTGYGVFVGLVAAFAAIALACWVASYLHVDYHLPGNHDCSGGTHTVTGARDVRVSVILGPKGTRILHVDTDKMCLLGVHDIRGTVTVMSGDRLAQLAEVNIDDAPVHYDHNEAVAWSNGFNAAIQAAGMMKP